MANCPFCGSKDVVILKMGSLKFYLKRFLFDVYSFLDSCILYLRGYEWRWRKWELTEIRQGDKVIWMRGGQ